MVEKIRCFVAVEIPDGIKMDIDEYIFGLKKIMPEAKWVKAKNMHITLKFLGEIEPSFCSQIKELLKGISEISSPFELKISGSGVFPNLRRPRVFWLGLQQDENRPLFRIYTWIDEKLETLGVDRENRKFSPHLTLCRIKTHPDCSRLLDHVKRNEFKDKKFKVSEIVLMQSQLKPSGAVYTPLQYYPLAKKE